MSDINSLVIEGLSDNVSTSTGSNSIQKPVDKDVNLTLKDPNNPVGRMTGGQLMNGIQDKFNQPGLLKTDQDASLKNNLAKNASNISSGAGEVRSTVSPSPLSGSGVGNMVLNTIRKHLPGQN